MNKLCCKEKVCLWLIYSGKQCSSHHLLAGRAGSNIMRQNCQFHSLLNTTYKLLVFELNIFHCFLSLTTDVNIITCQLWNFWSIFFQNVHGLFLINKLCCKEKVCLWLIYLGKQCSSHHLLAGRAESNIMRQNCQFHSFHVEHNL